MQQTCHKITGYLMEVPIFCVKISSSNENGKNVKNSNAKNSKLFDIYVVHLTQWSSQLSIPLKLKEMTSRVILQYNNLGGTCLHFAFL